MVHRRVRRPSASSRPSIRAPKRRAVARTFVVSPRTAWGSPLRAKAFREQLSVQTLVILGERLQRDAAVLLDSAAFDREEIPSASVVGEVRFESESGAGGQEMEVVFVRGRELRRATVRL